MSDSNRSEVKESKFPEGIMAIFVKIQIEFKYGY